MTSICRLCGSSQTEVHFQRGKTYFWHGPRTPYFDATLAKANLSAQIYVCRDCGFIGLPVDGTLRDMLHDYYTSPLSMPGTTHGTNNKFAKARTDEFFTALAELGQKEAPKKVLEVGCQQGFLLAEFLRRGAARAVGVEPGDIPPTEDHQGKPIDVKRGFLSEELVGETGFDFAYSLQVFEHIENPNQFLSVLHRLLKLGGKLLLAVPNEGLALNAGNPGVFVYQHLNLFTEKTLESALLRNGFKPVAKIFDQEKPLYLIAEKIEAATVPSSRQSLGDENRELLQRYTRRVDAKLERISEIAKGKPDTSVALWGCNAAMANIYSWGEGFRERKWRVIDSDPSKIGVRFGGIPTVVEPPDVIQEVTDVIVIPYRAEASIMRMIDAMPNVKARFHRLYED